MFRKITIAIAVVVGDGGSSSSSSSSSSGSNEILIKREPLIHTRARRAVQKNKTEQNK